MDGISTCMARSVKQIALPSVGGHHLVQLGARLELNGEEGGPPSFFSA